MNLHSGEQFSLKCPAFLTYILLVGHGKTILLDVTSSMNKLYDISNVMRALMVYISWL